MAGRIAALGALAAAAGYLAMALALPLGTWARPGAGFYPAGVALWASAVALASVLVSPRGLQPGESEGAKLPRAARARVLHTIAALAGFCLLLAPLGFPLVAAGFVVYLLRALGAAWRVAGLVAVPTAALAHWVFTVLLGVPLPRGPFLD